MFNFLTQANVIIGNGEFRKYCQNFDQFDSILSLFIVDEGFAKSSYWNELKNILLSSESNEIYFIETSGKKEPTYDDLEKLLIQVKEINPDCIIACGGGSCMDLAKATAALLKNDGDILDYKGFDKLKQKGVKTVLVPTTAGTGSDASYNASFVDTNLKLKMGINGNNMFPGLSILDGETLKSCPKKAALGAAIDALTHSLEGYVCNNANEFSDMIAEKSFDYLINNIERIDEIADNEEIGLNLLKGAYLAGIVQMNSGSGIAAAISYPLSVYYGVPHGIGGGIFLLDIAKFNINNGYDKYINLTKYVKNSSIKSSLDLINHMQLVFDKLGVPKELSQFGIFNSDKERICNVMMTQQKAFDQNPIKFSCDLNFSKLINNYLI